MGDKTGLIDGMNVTANVSLDKAIVPAVPTSAIVSFQGQDYIFIVTDMHIENEHPKKEDVKSDSTAAGNDKTDVKAAVDGIRFERIPVVKGTTYVGYSEITLLKEIPVNTKIVVKGAFFILAKMTNTVNPCPLNTIGTVGFVDRKFTPTQI